jgi:DNA modification methylase
VKPYYEQDGITIYHADAREALPALSAEVLITDPPYGVNFAGSSTRHSGRAGLTYTKFDDTPEYIDEVVIPVINLSLQKCKRAAITPGIRNARRYPVPDGEGVIWYPSGANVGPWGFVTHQPIYYYGKCPFLLRGKGSMPTGFSSTESAPENGHPCPKPFGTMLWMVKRVCEPTDIVLDPFMGSGTTLEAAKHFGCRAIGIEIEERYCEIAANRLAQGVLFGTGDKSKAAELVA